MRFYWLVLDVTRKRLMQWRIMQCDYCENTGTGCDCGACGLIYGGSHGYAWCLNYNPCPICGREG